MVFEYLAFCDYRLVHNFDFVTSAEYVPVRTWEEWWLGGACMFSGHIVFQKCIVAFIHCRILKSSRRVMKVYELVQNNVHVRAHE